MSTSELKAGMIFEDHELIAPLSRFYHMMPTWKACGADGDLYVLRFLSGYSISHAPQHDLEPITSLSPISGFVPPLTWKFVTLGASVRALMVRRPFVPDRMLDHFPANLGEPPSPALLNAFGALADTLETLQSARPTLDFDLSPGNLLMDGDKPILADVGLAHHKHYEDMNNRIPFASHVEPEHGMPLSASYPAMWQSFAATKSPYQYKIKRTDAQYALGALYVYLRTRLQVFDTPERPFPSGESETQQQKLLKKIEWYSKLHDRVQAYEEHGTLELAVLPDPHERAVVARALSRDINGRYANCGAFVEALRRLR